MLQRFFVAVLITSGFLVSVLFRDFWTIDDAFIYQNYVRNLVDGVGLIYSPSTTAEGFSSPLWLLILSAAGYVGLEGIWAAKWVGILCGLAAALTCTVAFPGEFHWRRSLAVGLLIALQPALGWWSVSGMETPLMALLLSTSFILVLFNSPRAVAASAGMLAVTRPEAVMFAVPFGLWIIWLFRGDRLTRAHFLQSMALILGPFGAWEGFRLFHYGTLISNSSLAKLGSSAFIGEEKGLGATLKYLSDSLIRLPSLWVLLALALGIALPEVENREESLRNNILIAAAVFFFYLIFVLVVGGDWMPWSRFFVPLLPLSGAFYLCTWDNFDRFGRAFSGVVLILLLLTGAQQYQDFVPAYSIHKPSNYEVVARMPDQREPFVDDVRADPVAHFYAAMMLRFSEPGDVVLHADVGQPGYFAWDLSYMDAFGLVSRFEAGYLQGWHSSNEMREHFSNEAPAVAFVLVNRTTQEPAMRVALPLIQPLEQDYQIVARARWFGDLEMLVFVRSDAVDRSVDGQRLSSWRSRSPGLDYDHDLLTDVATSVDTDNPRRFSVRALGRQLGWRGGR